MNKSESENLKLFKGFNRISCLCGTGKFKSRRNLLAELFLRFYSLILAIVFIWLAISNHVNNFYVHFDKLICMARGIDRSELLLMAASVCVEASVRRKQDFKVINIMDNLDKALSESFDVKFNYKLINMFNHLLTFLIVTPPLLVARQFFTSRMDIFYSGVFLFFVFAQLIVAVTKTAYLSFIVAFMIRFRALDGLVQIENLKIQHQLVLVDLSFEISRLVDNFNESFGFTALMIIGEKNQRSLFYGKPIKGRIAHFNRLLKFTRTVFHINVYTLRLSESFSANINTSFRSIHRHYRKCIAEQLGV